MDIERVSEDGRTREVWTVQLVDEDGAVRAKVVYYLRQCRPTKRHGWALDAYWSGVRVASQGRIDAPPRLAEAEILDTLRSRMVVEWPAEGGKGAG